MELKFEMDILFKDVCVSNVSIDIILLERLIVVDFIIMEIIISIKLEF